MLTHRNFIAICLLSAFLALSPVMGQNNDGSSEGKASKSSFREYAFAQHEIVTLLIKNGDFNQAWDETQKLLSVSIPQEFEQNAVKSVTIISELFFRKGRVDLAHQVLEQAGKVIDNPANQGTIYLNQARLYKAEGLNEKALLAYRKYQELVNQAEK